jgi:hypothetical protein
MLDPYRGLLVKGPVGTTDRRKKSAKGDDLHNRKERLLGVGLHCCRVQEEAAHRHQHDCEMMRMAAAPLLLAFMRFHPWRTQLFVCALLLPFFAEVFQAAR